MRWIVVPCFARLPAATHHSSYLVLVQLLSLVLAKQQAADNAMHTNSGGIAIGKLHMHLYNALALTMKSARLVLNGWLFTMFIASQPAVLAPKPSWQDWVYGG